MVSPSTTPPSALLARHEHPADATAAFLLERVEALRGAVAWQGQWVPPLPQDGASPLVGRLAVQRLWKLDAHATRSLLAWSAGRRRVELLLRVPDAMELLAFQAVGWRCISLVEEQETPAVHHNSYLFVVHDLCHLEKFVDPQHHQAQVGFFHTVHRALNHPQWRALERDTLDAAWVEARNAVVSDMNGSVIFLMAALKMKLKMAARRLHARRAGVAPPAEGRLTAAEEQTYRPLEECLVALMELPQDVVAAAHLVNKRRDTPVDALRFHAYFDGVGARVLAAAPP